MYASSEEVEALREEYRKSVASSQAGMRAAKASAAPWERSEGRGQNGWLPYGRTDGAPSAREQPQALPGDRICAVCNGVNFKGKRGELCTRSRTMMLHLQDKQMLLPFVTYMLSLCMCRAECYKCGADLCARPYLAAFCLHSSSLICLRLALQQPAT